MSDPERLIDRANDLEGRLLSAGLDEVPPPELLARTLTAVGAASAASASAVGAVATAGAAKAAGGGLLGAVAIGALAGVLAVGGYEVATHRPPAPPPAPALVAPVSAVVAAPPPLPAPPPAAASPPVVVPSAPRPASATAPTVSLTAELALLDEARSALRAGDHARARAALDRHAREVPRPQLAREASLLRAELADGG